jgi:small GTP-binding protein
MNAPSTEEETKEYPQLKIVIIGESSVGKSAIINQYINQIFIEQAITTIGTDKFSKFEIINNQKIKLNVWDTAGQERFRSLSPLFLKGSNIVLMVYDITNKFSFTELNNFWIEKVKDNTDNIILGVIANKSDLYDMEVVPIEEGKKFASDINGVFFETSARNLETVRNVFIKLVGVYLEKYGNSVNQSLGESLDNSQDNIKKKRNCC